MQSDDRSAAALAALAQPCESFRSALVAAVDELTAYLESRRAPEDERARRETARLGAFAGERIDGTRFSRLTAAGARVGPATLERIQRGIVLLQWHVNQGSELFRLRVQEGTDLRDTVRDALALRGRVFSAARHIEMLRAGRSVLQDHDDALPFRAWRRSERLLAPPLIIDIDGADLQAAGLLDYLDGAQKIVLVVHGSCPPAPLARLVSPTTFVAQVRDAADLAALASFDGPGIAALVPEGCAVFTHDPARGASLRQRLTVTHMPARGARVSGMISARVQAEDLEWLREIAALAVGTPVQQEADAPAAGPEPADQLAGWLLRLGETEMSR